MRQVYPTNDGEQVLKVNFSFIDIVKGGQS